MSPRRLSFSWNHAPTVGNEWRASCGFFQIRRDPFGFYEYTKRRVSVRVYTLWYAFTTGGCVRKNNNNDNKIVNAESLNIQLYHSSDEYPSFRETVCTHVYWSDNVFSFCIRYKWSLESRFSRLECNFFLLYFLKQYEYVHNLMHPTDISKAKLLFWIFLLLFIRSFYWF